MKFAELVRRYHAGLIDKPTFIRMATELGMRPWMIAMFAARRDTP